MHHLGIASSLQDFQRDKRQTNATGGPNCIRTDYTQNAKQATYYVSEKKSCLLRGASIIFESFYRNTN